MGFDTWGVILIFFLFTPLITVGGVSIWWYLNSRKHQDDPPMTREDYYTRDVSEQGRAREEYEKHDGRNHPFH